METTAIDRPDVDTTGLENFSIPCDITESLIIFGRAQTAKDCERPAEWTARFPCCGRATLMCDHHKNDGHKYLCYTCRKPFDDLIGWERL